MSTDLPSNSDDLNPIAEPSNFDNSKRTTSARHPLEWLVILFALVLPTIVTYCYFVLFANGAAPVQYAVYSIGKCVQFALPVVWIFGVLRQPISWQQVRASLRGPGWISSIGMALIVLLAMLAVYRFWLCDQPWFAATVSEVRDKVSSIGCDRRAGFIAMASFYSLVHSLLEEYYWRWFVFGRLRHWIPATWAIVVSSLGFMAHHVIVLAKYFDGFTPMAIVFSLCVAIGGAFWAWLYQRTGSLWPAWAGHAIVDAAIFAVGYQIVFS